MKIQHGAGSEAKKSVVCEQKLKEFVQLSCEFVQSGRQFVGDMQNLGLVVYEKKKTERASIQK